MDLCAIVNQILTFILILYGDPNFPRNIVQTIIDHMNTFIRNEYLPSIKNDIMKALEGNQISESSLRKIEACFKQHENVFVYVDTEAKRLSLLKKKKSLTDFEQFLLGQIFVDKLEKN